MTQSRIRNPCGYLVDQLQDDPGKKPPGRFAALGAIGEEAWTWLRKNARRRRRNDSWPEGLPIDEELAEQWYKEYETHGFREEDIEELEVAPIPDMLSEAYERAKEMARCEALAAQNSPAPFSEQLPPLPDGYRLAQAK